MTNTVLNVVPIKVKSCVKCEKSKSLSEFHNDKHAPDGKTYKCGQCINSENRERHLKNPEAMKIRNKKSKERIYSDPVAHAKHKAMKTAWNHTPKYYDMYYKKRFGITFAEVNSMLSNQNGLCSNIGCSRQIAIAPVGDQVKACVDHCHATGKVRSMMCVRCNTLLGHVENDRNLIMGLMDYLNKH